MNTYTYDYRYDNLTYGANTSINPFFYGTFLAATKIEEPSECILYILFLYIGRIRAHVYLIHMRVYTCIIFICMLYFIYYVFRLYIYSFPQSQGVLPVRRPVLNDDH